MTQNSPTPSRGAADAIRMEPIGKYKQTQNGNVHNQGILSFPILTLLA